MIDLPNKFSIITSSFFIPEGEDSTQRFILVNKSRFPYFIMAGKWMFQLFEAEKHMKNSVEWLYGLHGKLNAIDAYNSTRDTSHVILLEATASETISQNLHYFFAEKKIAGLNKTIRELHIRMFRKKLSEMIAQYIFQQYFIPWKQGKTEFESMTHAFDDLKKLP